MSLVCQNCGSQDIVTIQGQNFCINCGSQVAEPKVTAKTATPKGSGFKSAAVQMTAKRAAIAKPETQSKPAKLPPAKLAEKQSSPVKIEKSVEHSVNLKPTHRDDSQHSRTAKAHPLSYGLKVSAAISIPVGLVIGAGLYLGLDRDLMLYLISASLLLVAVMLVLAQSALLYGLSRAQDGRPAPRAQWWAVSRNGFIEVLNVDMVTLITLFITIAAGLGLWRAVATYHIDIPYANTGLLVVGNVVLAWVFLGVLAARRIAVPAVIIGNLTGTTAVRLGWQCYMRAGGHLTMALAETWVARLSLLLILATGLLVTGHYLPNLSADNAAIGTGIGITVVTFCLFVLMLQVETRVWLRQYRLWVNTYLAGQRLRLLAGRNKKAK
jgi:hypothetical protein